MQILKSLAASNRLASLGVNSAVKASAIIKIIFIYCSFIGSAFAQTNIEHSTYDFFQEFNQTDYTHSDLMSDEYWTDSGFIVIGSGDTLRINLWKAKQLAATLVLKINDQTLNNYPALTSGLKKWLLNHTQLLASDIVESPHRWGTADSQFCAQTRFERGAPIFFNYNVCKQSVKNQHDMIALLIHESMHHLGIPDDSRSIPDLVANLTLDSWKKGYLSWSRLSQAPIGLQKFSASAALPGNKVWVHGGIDPSNQQVSSQGAIYDTKTGEWTRLETLNAPELYNHKAFYHSNSNRVIVYGGNQELGGNVVVWKANAYAYDLQTQSWQDLGSPDQDDELDIPHGSLAAQASMLAGDKLFVIGADVRDPASPQKHNAVLNLKTGTWKNLTLPANLQKFGGQSLVRAGNNLIVWAGLDSRSRYTATGYAIDITSLATSPISTSGAPDASIDQQALWTGEYMVVFGGRNKSNTDYSQFGVYNPSRNSWKTYENDLLHNRTEHGMHWTGSEIIIYGGKTIGRKKSLYQSPVSFDPLNGSIKIINTTVNPEGRAGAATEWIANSLFVIGGESIGYQALQDAYQLNP